MKHRMTETFVSTATYDKLRETEVRDTVVQGLILRLRKTGSRSFIVRKMINGRRDPITLGSPDSGMTLAAARDAANRALAGGLEKPKPPKRDKTLHDIFNIWEETRANVEKNQYDTDIRRYVKTSILPYFKKKPVSEITTADCRAFYKSLDKDKLHTANRTFMALRTLFTTAIEAREISVNPGAGVKIDPEDPRTRVFELTEIGDVLRGLQALQGEHPVPVAVLKCALIISARIGEIRTMRWDQFDFTTGFWYLPASMRKAGVATTAPFGGFFRDFIERQPKTSETYVFPSPKDPEKPISYTNVNKIWRKIRPDTDAKIKDFRRTIATNVLMANMNAGAPIVQSLLGHKNINTTMRNYAHVGNTAPGEALEEYNTRLLEAILGPSDEF